MPRAVIKPRGGSKSMSRSRISRVSMCALLMGAVVIVLAGCGGGGSSSSSAQTSPATTTSTTTTSVSTPSTAASTTSSAASASGTTAPGSSLAVGDTATVPYQPVGANQSAKPKFTLQVTITALEKGSLNDFNGIKLDATEKASTPVYIKAKISNAGPGDAGGGGNPSVNVEGVDTSGETQQSVTFFGDFPRCEYVEAPKPFTKGKSFTTCLTFLIPGGITKAAYTGTEKYVLTPVTWK
jgi:cytoskeletal protein RodZ